MSLSSENATQPLSKEHSFRNPSSECSLLNRPSSVLPLTRERSTASNSQLAQQHTALPHHSTITMPLLTARCYVHTNQQELKGIWIAAFLACVECNYVKSIHIQNSKKHHQQNLSVALSRRNGTFRNVSTWDLPLGFNYIGPIWWNSKLIYN